MLRMAPSDGLVPSDGLRMPVNSLRMPPSDAFWVNMSYITFFLKTARSRHGKPEFLAAIEVGIRTGKLLGDIYSAFALFGIDCLVNSEQDLPFR